MNLKIKKQIIFMVRKTADNRLTGFMICLLRRVILYVALFFPRSFVFFTTKIDASFRKIAEN